MKIQSKILMVALGPLAVLGIIIVLLSNARINTVVTDSIMIGLKSAAVAVRDTLTYVDEGDYGFDRNNKFCKGEFNISKSPELVDNIKEVSDIDITIFYGNIRYMTSLLDSSDNRMIGTRAGDEVVKEVIENGNEYFSKNVDVYGEKYFGYYIPLYNNEGTPVGMVFCRDSAGRCQGADSAYTTGDGWHRTRHGCACRNLSGVYCAQAGTGSAKGLCCVGTGCAWRFECGA